ncbi:hypothetical protein FACS1894169_03380 [Bacteroidia bacterium]|nr:hypothetical protein FACS1894169_03380 [Bacteroidia bacterium]
MRLKQYSSDLSAQGWQVIEKIIQVQRKSKWDLKEIVNGIFYLTKNGCMWRDLPGEFPPGKQFIGIIASGYKMAHGKLLTDF